MSDTTSAAKRPGEVLRVLPHGTVIIWDVVGSRSYPYYKAGKNEFRLREEVMFETDPTDTVVMSVGRSEPPSKRRSKGVAAAKTASASKAIRAA